MLRVIIRFIDLAELAMQEGASPEQIAALPILRALQRLGEEIAEEEIDRIRDLLRQLESEFADLKEIARAS